MIKVSKIEHRGNTQILLQFEYNNEVVKMLKTIEKLQFTKTHKGWYIPYEGKSWKTFLALNLPFEIHTNTSENSEALANINQVNYKPTEITHTGTASPSLKSSDNAGITSENSTDVKLTLALHGDNGERYIHQSKGGREVWYSGGRFVIKISFNDEDVKFLKSIKGWWNQNLKRWIIKGTLDNLLALQSYYDFWDTKSYNKIEDIILTVSKPYAITLYKVPEERNSVMVQVIGHNANLDIIKHLSEREYHKENKRWSIPNDAAVIERLVEMYRKDGAMILNRLPLLGEDYQKMRPSYGDWKRHWLEKTDMDLRDIVEPYLDALSAKRYSLRTFDAYIGPFIRFVKHIGINKIHQINSTDIRSYMANLGSEKVSDTYLNTAINSIKFYYQQVVFNKDLVIEEIKRPKKAKPLPVILSTSEIDRILRSTENLKHATLLYTLYSSGIRLNEILSLRVEDLWWDRDQVMIKSGKGKKDRIVPFSGVLKRLMTAYFDEYKPIYWVFEGQDRKYQYSEKSVQNVVKRAALSAKINKKVTPHTIRHCYATHLLDGGTDIRYIQELLGHANITTTLIYTHVTNHSINKIQSPLDRLMSKDLDSGFLGINTKKSES
ncbi:MAG: tyrosine-type recombinase/integrase [Saprospiraceae bacterium]|nr:tyrosine-type recombinase/integrase [Saprospiraceae bacterium]